MRSEQSHPDQSPDDCQESSSQTTHENRNPPLPGRHSRTGEVVENGRDAPISEERSVKPGVAEFYLREGRCAVKLVRLGCVVRRTVMIAGTVERRPKCAVAAKSAGRISGGIVGWGRVGAASAASCGTW